MIDPQTYPGSSIFINKFDLADPTKYDLAQSVATLLRQYEIDASDCPVSLSVEFDELHLKQIHHHLFQDVFEWAGEFRSYDMKKGGDTFSPASLLEKELAILAAAIKSDDFLVGSGDEHFVDRMAQYIGWLGLIHPFPEGNGRAQRAFLQLLAKNAGRRMNFKNIRPWQNKEAAIQYHNIRDLEPLKILIRGTLS